MTVKELIIELQSISKIVGDEKLVYIERGGEVHAAQSVSFEGTTNDVRVITHG